MNWNTKENQEFTKAILALQNTAEAEAFLRDLLTEGEIKEFAKRFKVAKMLYKGVPYSEIEKETGFSSTTVARVSKWLNNGQDGYKTIINKLV
jgi:TrpR-related protein YerC/YecD